MIQELLEAAVAFHGHCCPGLAIGVRACEAVKSDPDLGSVPYGQLICVAENDACGVDAIQSLLGCSIGKGNLLLCGHGKQAFSFFDRSSGKALRLYLRAQKEEGCSREDWQQKLLSLPLKEVFTFSTPLFAIPEPPRIFTTIACEVCGEGAAEHKMRLQEGKKVCLECFKPYDRGW